MRDPSGDASDLLRAARAGGGEQYPSHYNPNQPRVPAGHQDGGQWTGGGPHQALTRMAALNGGPLMDAVLGHRDGVSRDQTMQLAYFRGPTKPWTRPQPPLGIEPPLPLRPAAPTIALHWLRSAILGISLYSLLSQFNDANRRAIIAFKAREFRPGSSEEGILEVEAVRFLDAQQVQDICERLGDIQKLTNGEFEKARANGRQLSPIELGNEIHKAAKIWTRSQNNDSFRSEISFAKIGDKLVDLEERKKNVDDGSADDTYGEEGSIRPDCYQRKDPKTVCIYDIKTGASGLSSKRMKDFARRTMYKYPCTEHVIVTEVRPGDPVPKTKGE